MPNETVLSPGTYYRRHIKPSDSNEHTPLDPIYANAIPESAVPIRAHSGWLLATQYENSILTVWIQTSTGNRWRGEFQGMRIAGVPPHHVGGLHGFGRKSIPREPTDIELNDLLKKSLKPGRK